MIARCIGGVADHVHLLLSMPASASPAQAMQQIKGGSSLWLHKTFSELRDFSWQEGYGAFSVSVSQLPETIAYIANQKAHHRKKTFQEEYLAFLKKHEVNYDERYLWG